MRCTWIEIIATILSVIGNIFVVYQSKIGFAIWLAANTLWIIFALNREDKYYWMAGLFFFYNILAVIGLIRW